MTGVFSRRHILKIASGLPFAGATSVASLADDRVFRHGISLLGEPKYKAGFSHFDYVNPDAPKGGKIRLAILGSFDSMNGNTINGDPIDPGVNEALLFRNADESFGGYGLLAESLWFPDDYAYLVCRLRPNAHFSDGEPVKPEDVVFSFDTVKANLPSRQAYYKDVLKAEKTGDHEVTFTFAIKGNRELPQIIGELAILPKHWWTGKDKDGKQRDVSKSTLEPPLGSGAYTVGKVISGQSYTLMRDKNYWGAKLAVNVGQSNFDEIEYQIYGDPTVKFEAFKGDRFDINIESSSKNWATGYDFAAVKNGSVLKGLIAQGGAEGMQCFALNLRKEKYQDVRVRRALNLAYDFEWAKENLFYGQYTRSRSYFNNSELEAKGLPSPEELVLLEPLRDKLPPEVFTTEYANPVNPTPQARRKNLQAAQALFAEAGWNPETVGTKRVLKNAKGEIFTMDFLFNWDAYERITLPYKEALELLGVTVTIRTLDESQYFRLQKEFDFDVIVSIWGQSLSPGNEQSELWTSAFADKKGSQNYLGIKNEAIDALVAKLTTAPDRKTLIAATRALDRALIWNNYGVPMWFKSGERLAYWKRVAHPEPLPMFGLAFPSIWWADDKAAATISKT
jgi:microcin C transport system substrate-binding protein